MNSIAVGFYGEGRADYDFLLPIVERILQVLLPHFDILPIPIPNDVVDIRELSQEEKLVYIAQMTCGYGLVVFHLDADAPTTNQAYKERFEPGYLEVVRRYRRGEEINKDIAPLIPVRMTEAWMMVDFEAFRQVTKTKRSADELGFVNSSHQVEAIQNPKAQFEVAVKNSQPGRRKGISPNRIYGPLAVRVRLEKLEKVPAYQEFRQRLTQMLEDLHYIS